jgi:penicillin-binding protein 1C
MSLKKLALSLILLAVLIGSVATARIFKTPLIDARNGSKQVVDRRGALLRMTLSGDEKYRLFTPLQDIPASAVEAVLMHEDRYFYFHPGVNPWSLAKAGVSTYLRGSRRIGGSTLTMQLARMTSTRGSKTITGKIHQVFRALYLEALYSKDEILEAYLNLLSYGGNIEGIGTASEIYFRKNASQMTLPEVLTLAVIPQNPNVRKTRGSGVLKESRSRLAASWLKVHPEDKIALSSLDVTLESKSMKELPFKAPHFVERVLSQSQGPEFSRISKIETSLDSSLQRLVELKVDAYVRAKSAIGIKNATVMVVDTRSMEVVAHVGSANYFDSTIQGQVNGAQAQRSPGSTLKPFVYGLAIDQGLIHPLTLMKDTPMSFGGFDPENFDRKFAGPLSATEALISSRNVPAVYLTSQLEKPSLYQFLKATGAVLRHEPKYYGLALSLGGAELSMEEIIRMYAMLANKGELKSLKWSHAVNETAPAPAGRKLLSSEASFLVLDMLRQNPREDQRFVDGLLRDSRPVAWKTGTSHGFRDAWTFGLIGPYAVGVWLGNFNGDENPSLIGREMAAPLFFNLVDGLKSQASVETAWLSTRDLNLKKVKVCTVSGLFPNAHCKHGTDTWFIPGKSPIAKCNVHREIKVDAASGLRLCEENGRIFKRETFEFWPSDLLMVFKTAGIPRKTPPSYVAGCEKSATESQGVKPTITSPRKDVSYTYRVEETRDVASEDRIPFAAVADGDAHVLHWFVGAEYVGKTSADKPFLWKAKVGHHIVRVVDDLGRSDSRAIDVKASR